MFIGFWISGSAAKSWTWKPGGRWNDARSCSGVSASVGRIAAANGSSAGDRLAESQNTEAAMQRSIRGARGVRSNCMIVNDSRGISAEAGAFCAASCGRWCVSRGGLPRLYVAAAERRPHAIVTGTADLGKSRDRSRNPIRKCIPVNRPHVRPRLTIQVCSLTSPQRTRCHRSRRA